MKISEFLVHLGENWGIIRTFLNFLRNFTYNFAFSYILEFFWNFLAANCPKIGGIFQELFRSFCRLHEELFSCEPPGKVVATVVVVLLLVTLTLLETLHFNHRIAHLATELTLLAIVRLVNCNRRVITEELRAARWSAINHTFPFFFLFLLLLLLLHIC